MMEAGPGHILHITTAADWSAAQEGARYSTDSLATEGFIHCSTEKRLAGVLERYFAGRGDLVSLEIDPALLDAPLMWEHTVWDDTVGSGEVYPHVYGTIPIIAIVGATPISAIAD